MINLYFTGIVKSVNIDIGTESHYDIKNLSEGEKQLLTILGLLQIQRENNCLFLLDEPDAFLYPKWQRKLASLLMDVGAEGQLVLSTHSPFTLGLTERNAIRIFDNGQVLRPSSDTLNRDINDIVSEVMGTSVRPQGVQEMINQFYNALSSKDKAESERIIGLLKEKLSHRDPFFLKAEGLLLRMRFQK